MHDVNRFDCNAQASRNQLRKGRLVPLTVAVRAGEHRHATRRVYAHFAALKQTCASAQSTRDIARCNATRFDVAGVANAALQTFCFTGSLARRKTCDIAQSLRLGHALQIVAHVILQGDRRLIRPTADEVALADFVLTNA